MESMEHQNKKIDYILIDSEKNETYILASDGVDEAIEFTPYSKEYARWVCKCSRMGL